MNTQTLQRQYKSSAWRNSVALDSDGLQALQTLRLYLMYGIRGLSGGLGGLGVLVSVWKNNNKGYNSS